MSYIPLIARVDSLPPLPESVLKIEELFTHDEPNIDDIVKVIEADPSLTADVLAKVNAPYYGFSKTIISILQAVTLFGASQIRSIVLSSSINRCFDINLSPYNISTLDFSNISSMQSELMFQWYAGIDIVQARLLTPIAFLMETGKILIAKDVLDNHKEEEFLADLETYGDISYVENTYTMMTTAQINALVFKHLHLQDTFSESMQYLDRESDAPAPLYNLVFALKVVQTAINVQEQLSENSIENALKMFAGTSLNIDSFKRAINRVLNKKV